MYTYISVLYVFVDKCEKISILFVERNALSGAILFNQDIKRDQRQISCELPLVVCFRRPSLVGIFHYFLYFLIFSSCTGLQWNLAYANRRVSCEPTVRVFCPRTANYSMRSQTIQRNGPSIPRRQLYKNIRMKIFNHSTLLPSHLKI